MKPWRALVLVLGSVGATALACSLTTDLDVLRARTCGTDGLCRVGVPSGWDGILLDEDGPADAGCAAPFGNPSFGTLASNPSGAELQCSCRCAPDNDGPCALTPTVYQTGTCTGSTTGSITLALGCITLGASGGTASLSFGDAGPRDSGCVGAVTEVRAAPTTTPHHLCAGAFFATECAASELCVPKGAKPLCIARAGDNPCPDPYTDKRVYFGAVEDSRTCTACDCRPTASACAKPPRITTGTSCDGGLTPIPQMGACVGGAFSNVIDVELEDGACAITSPPKASGAVKGTNPVTVCCTP